MTTASRMPSSSLQGAPQGGANLADILERVLDKGIVIAGDIKINLLDIELLTIKLRLVVASVERAKEMGIDWWEDDPALSSGARRSSLQRENEELRRRVEQLEGGTRVDGGALDPATGEERGEEADRGRDDDRGEDRDRGGERARGAAHDRRGERERDR